MCQIGTAGPCPTFRQPPVGVVAARPSLETIRSLESHAEVIAQREDTLIIDQRRVLFGQVLAAERQQRGLSQTELGRQLGGVVQATVSSWESGTTTPSVDQLFALEALFGVDFSTSLGRSPADTLRESTAQCILTEPSLPEWARPVALAMFVALCKSTEAPPPD